MGTITSGKDFQYLKDYQQRLLVWTIDTQHRVELFLWTMIMKKIVFTNYYIHYSGYYYYKTTLFLLEHVFVTNIALYQ